MYKIQNNKDFSWLVYSELYNAVAWVSSDKIHKYYDDSFYFSFEQLQDLVCNLLKNEEITVYFEEV